MLKPLILAPALGILLASCASVHNHDPAEAFQSAWDASDAKRQEAAAVGYEWRDTKKMLKKAQEEFEAGNTEAALKLVARAREESEDAIAQHTRETNAWASRVIQ